MLAIYSFLSDCRLRKKCLDLSLFLLVDYLRPFLGLESVPFSISYKRFSPGLLWTPKNFHVGSPKIPIKTFFSATCLNNLNNLWVTLITVTSLMTLHTKPPKSHQSSAHSANGADPTATPDLQGSWFFVSSNSTQFFVLIHPWLLGRAISHSEPTFCACIHVLVVTLLF